MPRNKEFDRWAAKNLDDTEKRRWFQAAIEIDERFAGTERQCPKCEFSFTSRFNRGKCPQCGHMFFASNSSCGSNEWLRVPDHSLFAEPIVHGSYTTNFYCFDIARLPSPHTDMPELLGKYQEEIDSINEFFDEPAINCEDCINSLLTTGTTRNDDRAMNVYAFEIVCMELGHHLQSEEDIFDLKLLPLTSGFSDQSVPLELGNAKEFPQLTRLSADAIAAERETVEMCEPRMPGSVRESELLQQQLAEYQSVLDQAIELSIDVYAFRY